MTLRELCAVIPAASKLRIKKRPGDEDGTVCLRYEVYDPLELGEIPELAELQAREVLMIRPDMVEEGRLVIVLNERRK